MDLIQRKLISNVGGVSDEQKSNILFRKTIDLPGFDLGSDLSAARLNVTGSSFGNLGSSANSTVTNDINGKSITPRSKTFTRRDLVGNSAKLTKSNGGTTFGLGDAYAYVGGTLQTIGNINAAALYDKTAADFIGSGGNSIATVNGIQYEQLNPINEAEELSNVSLENTQSALGAAASGAAAGAAIGSVVGPWGTAIGGVVGGLAGGISGIFAGNSRKRKAEKALAEARERQRVINLTNLDLAGTSGLQQSFAKRYGNLLDLQLYAAAEGKESDVNPQTGETFEKFMVNTPYGKLYAPQNSWVSKGEVIKSKDGSLYKVKNGPNDTARAYLSNDDTVFSTKVINPETGNPIASDVRQYAQIGQLDRLEQNQQIGRLLGYMKTINKYRKLPGFALGSYIDGNLLSTVGNLVAANSQYREANKPLRLTNIGEINPYEQKALNDLYGLHLDYYPTARLNRSIEARGYNQIARSGGLSAGLKLKSRVQQAYNTQMANADAIYKNNIQNNAYLAQAAQAALNAGQHSAQLKQQANIFNEEMLAKAHNAALQGRLMSLFNAMNAFSNYYANAFKLKMGNKALSLYEQQVNSEAADRAAMIAAMKFGNNGAKEKEQESLPGPDFYLNRNLNSNKPVFTDKYGIRLKNITDFDWSNPVVQQQFADKLVPFVMPKIGSKKRAGNVRRTTKRK